MIQLKNVTKIYEDGTTAVDSLSLHVAAGETFGLIGTSGCGKTTTLKMINRLTEPTSGAIAIDGKQSIYQDPHELRRKIGYVIQDVGLFPHYTVQENIATVPRLLEWDEQRIAVRSEELLQMVGLDPKIYSERSPGALSGGQQQRVGLARALAADPPIILMDEPFGALDPITKQEIRKEAESLFSQIQKTIVLVTHDVFEAFELCDRICLLDKGNLQQVGTPKELLFHPANDFVRSFFAANRFQLELLSIPLADVLKKEEGVSELYWSPPVKEEPTDSTGIDEERTLFSILEEMEQRKHQNVAIIHRVDDKVIDSLGFSDLMDRFQQHKNQLKRRGHND